MRRDIWINCIAYFFILLFLYTGFVKLTEINLFKEQLTSSPLLGPMVGFITWALPIAEILLAVTLFVPAWRLYGLILTLALMAIFTIYVVVIISIDNHLSCSCGGIIEDLSPRQHVLFNSACVILSGIAILMIRRKHPAFQYNWLTRGGAILAFLVIGWTLFTAFSAPAVRKTGLEGRLLPDFDILLPDSVTHLNSADIPTGKPIIFIGFSPTCKHCGAETEDIVKHITKFVGIRIYFVTPYSFHEMRGFYKYFKLNNYPGITMGRDSSDYFMTYFKADGVPFTAIFDSKKRLKQVIGSQADWTQLVKAAGE